MTRGKGSRGLHQVSPALFILLALITGLVLKPRGFSPEEAASAYDLVDADVTDMDGGEDDE